MKELAEKRSSLFLRVFEQVERSVSEIYKKLTIKDSLLNQGGSAQLILEDRSNPFERPIHYSPTPPGKRSNIESASLSGGEKTVAALALLFALIQVKKPPMLLLDEVDAFLDPENVTLITDFIREELHTQTILVSHKENVVKHAKSLVGTSFIKD